MANTRQVFTSDGRHRVAYEMALMLWTSTNDGNYPKMTDQDEFLRLVKDCTIALVHHQS